MDRKNKHFLYPEYRIFLATCIVFVAAAFVFDRPQGIINGLGRIFVSRGLLLTDYMVVGGIGAAIINSTLVGVYSVLLLYWSGAKPTGATIMSLWMAVGWTYWGANVLSIIPLTCGVWLYAQLKKRPFADFAVVAILGETIAPIVSVFFFSNPVMLHLGIEWHLSLNIIMGIFAGLICGFLLPAIASAAARMHDGYTLYNIGVTGGMIALFLAGLFKAFGVSVPTEMIWHSGDNLRIAIFLYVLFAVLIFIGLRLGWADKTNHIKKFKDMCSQTGHAPNDFYQGYGDSSYINMGLLGIIGTTVALVLGGDLNGATFACIFSMVAFGTLGKHVYNVLPLMLGGIICAFLNTQEVNAPTNILAILFSTCLAPIAGQFGWGWGMVAGFLHVVMVIHVGPLTNGFNLYNNGFASGFVAFFLVPVIMALKREKTPQG